MDAEDRANYILSKMETDGLIDYIQQIVTQNSYLIYDPITNYGTCTRCGTRFLNVDAEFSGKHNKRWSCPNCSESCIIKSAGRGRNNITERARVLNLFRYEQDAYAVLLLVYIEFREIGKPTIILNPNQVFEFSANGSRKYIQQYNYQTGIYEWMERNRVHITTPTGMMSGTKYWPMYEYADDVEDYFYNTDLKYLFQPELFKNINAQALVRYMEQGLRYQSIELLYKAGFTQLIRERLDGRDTDAANWRGKSLEKILRLPRRDIRILARNNPGNSELRVFQTLTPKQREMILWPIIYDMTQFQVDDIYTEIQSYTTLEKFGIYLASQTHYVEMEKGVIRNTRILYQDYFRAAKKLGLDLRRKKVLLPDNLKETHDRTVATLIIEENRERDALIKEKLLGIDFNQNGLIVIEAQSQQDLNNESFQLHHCVKTYGDRLANGKCRIFFIRKENEPEKSFYTLETSMLGEFVQCRGYRNCSMTEDVREYTAAFMQELHNVIKKAGNNGRRTQYNNC